VKELYDARTTQSKAPRDRSTHSVTTRALIRDVNKRTLQAVACVLLLASACSSGTNANDEARAACRNYLPQGAATGTITVAGMRKTLQKVETASAHAAKAAKADSHWDKLNQAESDMLDLWKYVVNVMVPIGSGPGGYAAMTSEQRTEYSQLQKTFDSAARTARAECAKANA
jgi:hypothetical protein